MATAQVNGLAVASLILSLLFLCGVGSLLGFVMGLVALDQIKKADGWQTGKGLAVAGTIIGGIGLGLFALWALLLGVGAAAGGVS